MPTPSLLFVLAATPRHFQAKQNRPTTKRAFPQKPQGDRGLIDDEFSLLSIKVINFIDRDTTSFEGDPITRWAESGQLAAFEYHGSRLAMDTVRDGNTRENLWVKGLAPWKKL